MPHVLEIKRCVNFSVGILVGFWSCSLLKTREDGSREATSKAQAMATHALNALSTPKEKEGGEMLREAESFGVERDGLFVHSFALVQQ